MNGNDLLDSMGLVDPELIEQADEPPRKRRHAYIGWVGLAASLVLIGMLSLLWKPWEQPPSHFNAPGIPPYSTASSVPQESNDPMPAEPDYSSPCTTEPTLPSLPDYHETTHPTPPPSTAQESNH